MSEKKVPEIRTSLKNDIVEVPDAIRRASGIIINGLHLKSFLFTTDVALINNTDADAILAVYPFTPSPAIIQSVRNSSLVPVAAGVGGSKTSGSRSADMALFAESIGSSAVVVNVQTTPDTIRLIEDKVDIPIIYTVISEYNDIDSRVKAGVDIVNVSGGKNTAKIVRSIREEFPDLPIIATGGRKEKTIMETIEAGANAISYTPPPTSEIFQRNMEKYREELVERFGETDL